MTDYPPFSPLEPTTDALNPFDGAFDEPVTIPTSKAKTETPRHTTTIFVRINNPAQFNKAKAIIAAALHGANIDHHL